MGKFTGMDGRAITSAALSAIRDAAKDMREAAARDDLPVEYRAKIQKGRTDAAKAARHEATDAMLAWADTVQQAATKVINTRTLGDTATESRRVADEIRISRIVETARADRNPKAVSGDLAQQADEAFIRGDADEALVLAQASMALGGPRMTDLPSSTLHPTDLIKHITIDRDLADPVKAKAYRELNEIAVVEAIYDRDVMGALAGAIQDSIGLARTLGDNAGAQLLMGEAAGYSMAAKYAGADMARREGVPYVEPAGVLHSLPRNVDPRGPVQPEGATLQASDRIIDGRGEP